jgi:hypothetical protein
MRILLISLFLFLFGKMALHGILPMREQWHYATSALQNGNAAAAYSAFEAFSTWYGEEPHAKEPEFRESLHRLWAIAAIGAGHYSKAVELIKNWMAEQKSGAPFHSFLLFQLIRLYNALGDPETARPLADLFLNSYPELPERALIRWYLAQAAFQAGNLEEARAQWLAIREDTLLPEIGKSLAAGALALLELQTGNAIMAYQYLKATDQSNSLIRSWRALLAPSLVAQLIVDDHPMEALQSSGWLAAPNENFTRALSSKATLNSHRNPIRNSIWEAHWIQEKKQLQNLLEQTQTRPMDLYPLRLRALRKGNRPVDVCILAQAILASADKLHPTLQASASREGIEALFQLQAWHEAGLWIDRFVKQFPADPNVPNMRLMAARALAGQRKWADAISLIQPLREQHPNHRAEPSWAFLHGEWLLADGQPTSARSIYEALRNRAPKPWQDLISLQCAKCLHAEGQSESAEELLTSILHHESALSATREAAAIELLKIQLRDGSSDFDETYSAYTEAFPDGRLHAMADNLAGAYALATGQSDEARRLWSSVAAFTSPEALYARRQLLSLMPAIGQTEVLQLYATEWLLTDWEHSQKCSVEGLEAAALFQKSQNQAALPPALVATLFEALIEANDSIPPIAFMQLLEGAWETYSKSLDQESDNFSTWLESLASPNQDSAYLRCTARLYLAEQLERAGRSDSADSHRIHVLSDPHDINWDALPAFILAQTANRYDFPDAVDRLNTFIDTFRVHRRYPDALFLLADRFAMQKEHAKAISLLSEIVTDWPASSLVDNSRLLLARHHLELDQPHETVVHADALLQDPESAPGDIAAALSLRIQADLALKHFERALLGGIRLLSLYGNFTGICSRTTAQIQLALDDTALSAEATALYADFCKHLSSDPPSASSPDA